MPFSFERITDPILLKRIITDPKLWDRISDDYCPSRDDFQPNPNMLYVVVRDDQELLGLWAFHLHNAICWEVHTCLLPVAWGDRGRRAALEMAEWLWANTECLRLITNVPAFNRLAFKFAKAAGMEQYGVNKLSYMKQGKLRDQILLGLSKPQVSPSCP